MSTRRRWYYSQQNNFSAKIKDYIIPIIWFFLILFLVYSCFWGWSNKNKTPENQVWIKIEKEADSEATIFYSWWDKKSLADVNELFKTEKIRVTAGKIKFTTPDWVFTLNKNWELTYREDGTFLLSSGELWIDSSKAINLDMSFAKLKISENSHISLAQNEVNSTIYSVAWKVEVANLVGKNTILAGNEKLEIARWDASDNKVDLFLAKTPLDSYFLNSTWYIANDGLNYINSGSTEDSSTGKTATWTTKTGTSEKTTSNISGKSKYITFSNLLDESNVSTSPISIAWAYDTEDVAKIEVNWKIATLNPANGTFKIEWVSVSNKENDLVFKVFDASEELKEKFVYTVYNDVWVNNISKNWQTNTNTANTSFSVDGSKFTFTAPSTTGTYTSTEDFITIRWNVLASGIDSVTVNDLKLSSFNGKTWRYHASTDYGNLVPGTNIYEVKYFSGNSMVYKNFFTIVKKWAQNIQTTTKETNTTSKTNTEVNLEANPE